jgi:hypothetical protein
MSHIYHPDLGDPRRKAILIDGCEDCESQAERLYDLDREFTAALWGKMVAVNHESSDHLNSYAEKKAVDQLWKFALLLERYTDVDPWSLFREEVPG